MSYLVIFSLPLTVIILAVSPSLFAFAFMVLTNCINALTCEPLTLSPKYCDILEYLEVLEKHANAEEEEEEEEEGDNKEEDKIN